MESPAKNFPSRIPHKYFWHWCDNSRVYYKFQSRKRLEKLNAFLTLEFYKITSIFFNIAIGV